MDLATALATALDRIDPSGDWLGRDGRIEARELADMDAGDILDHLQEEYGEVYRPTAWALSQMRAALRDAVRRMEELTS